MMSFKRIKTFRLFEEANEFGNIQFKDDIKHIKMIMSDISDDGIDFRVFGGERDFPDEKDTIYIKIYNIPFKFKDRLGYFDKKWKQLISEMGDLYILDYIRVTGYHSDRVWSYKSYDDFYREVKKLRLTFSSLDFEFSSHEGKDVF